MNKLTISLTIFAMALAGCGDDDRPGDIMIPDSGPGTDSGPVGTDMGPADVDMGPTGACADMIDALPADFTPRCSADTATCVEGAMSNDEFFACLDADTTAPYMDMMGLDCGFCINYQSIQCADANGCHDEWAAFNCCAEANGCEDTACAQANCGSELTAFQNCDPTADCQAQVFSCFPSTGG